MVVTTRKAWRRVIWERHCGICGLCGEPVDFEAMDIDRVVPGMDGGTYANENVRPAHPTCNRRRGVLDMHAKTAALREPCADPVQVRLPETVHGRLTELAKRERRSLNAQLVVLLERALGTRPAGDQAE